MDPLSMVASIGSICGVTVRLISTLSEFVDEVREAPKEVQSLSNELASLYACLGHIKIAIQGPRVSKISDAWTTDFEKVVDDCGDTLADVQKIVDKARATETSRSAAQMWKMIKFSFKSKQVDLLRKRIAAQTGILSNLLAALAESRAGHMEKRLEDIHEKVDELILSRRRVKEVLVVLDKDENNPEAADYVLKDQTSRRTQEEGPPANESPVPAPIIDPITDNEVEPKLPPPSSSDPVPDLVPILAPDSTPSDVDAVPSPTEQPKALIQNNRRRLMSALCATVVAAAVMDIQSGEQSKLKGSLAVVQSALAPTITDFQLVTVTKTSTAKPSCKTATRTLTETSESTQTITKSFTESITLQPPKPVTVTQTRTETVRQTVTKQQPPEKSDTESLVQALGLSQQLTSEDHRVFNYIAGREWHLTEILIRSKQTGEQWQYCHSSDETEVSSMKDHPGPYSLGLRTDSFVYLDIRQKYADSWGHRNTAWWRFCGTQNLDEVQVHENLVMVLSPRDSWDPYDFVLELANEDDAAALAEVIRHLRSLCWDAWKLHTLAFAKINDKIDVSSPDKLNDATHEELKRRNDKDKSSCLVM